MSFSVKNDLFEKEFDTIQRHIEQLQKETDYSVLTETQLFNRYEFLKNAVREKTMMPSHQMKAWRESELEFIAEALLVVEEVVTRTTGLKPFFTQRKAAYALYSGHIIDMKTGEGKTLAGLLSACIHRLYDEKVFIVSANEYLSKRDYEFSKPTYDFLKITSAYVDAQNKDKQVKKNTYVNDVIYANNRTLVTDFISSLNAKCKEDIFMPRLQHDGTKYMMDGCVAIIDEIDYILLDEGKNFFTQSKEVKSNEEVLKKAFKLAKTFDTLMFYQDEELHGYHLTEKGIEAACNFYGVDKKEYFSLDYKDSRKAVLKSLEALYKYKRDRDYIVKDDRVYTINYETGRINEFSRLTDGVHQLLEVKENVPVKNDIKANCGVTYPDFYKRFKSFSGMSGTIATERKEIDRLYQKEVIEIEPNIPSQRIDRDDVVCKNKKDKDINIISEVMRAKSMDRPVLLVVSGYEEGKHIQNMLKETGIEASLLTAKNNEEEATILAKSGIHGNVTITTIMAGRGVDIVPDEKAEEAGGLLVIGDGHFYSRRVDNQLRGRTGRQGAKGETVFFIYLGDEISATYADKLGTLSFAEQKLKDVLKMEDDEESVGTKQIKKMYNEAQREREYKDYERRSLFMELFSILSREYIELFAQKNEFLLSDDEGKVDILMRMNKKQNHKERYFSLSKKDTEKVQPYDIDLESIPDDKFISLMNERWEYFFDEDRFRQRLKLNSMALNDNFIAQYSYDNKARWHKLLKEIREDILKEAMDLDED